MGFKHSEETYCYLINNSPLCIILLSKDGKILECNTITEQLFGYKKEEYIGKNFIDIKILNLTENTVKNLFEILSTNKTLRPIEVEAKKAEGTLIWIRIQAAFIELGGKQVIQVICQDITAQKIAEEEIARLLDISQKQNEELRRSEEKFRYLFENSPSSIILLSEEGMVLDCNPITEDLLGYEKREFLGIHLTQIKVLNITKRMIENLYKIVCINKRVPPIEIEAYKKDGTSVWLRVQASLIEFGEKRLIQVIAQDISAQKESEEYVIKLLDTVQMQNEELKQLDRLKDEFFADVAHDFRNPLTAIKGIAGILRDSKNMTPKEIRGIDIIYRNEERLERLIDELINYNKIKEGIIQLKKDKFKVSRLINDLKQDFQVRLSKKQLKILDSYETDLEVILDEDQITRVLRNLIENAIKFSYPNSEININSNVIESKWIFSITDHGVGIKKENIPRIFKRFRKLDDPQEFNIKGIGLGLTISKGIIEKYGGTIWVDSPGLGKGTTFFFEIPINN